MNVFIPAMGHDSLLSAAQKASACAVAILLLIGAQTGSAQTTPPEANAYTTDSPEARATAKLLHGQDLEGKDGSLSKAGGELARLYQRQRSGLQKKKQKAVGEGLAATVSDNKVVIDAAASGSAKALMKDLEGLGLRQAARSGRIVSGRLPISAIAEAAGLSTLQFMRPSVTRSSVGDVTTQGNEATRVSEARTSAEVSGTGMKVGVISDTYNQKVDPGVDDADDDIASGDLPPKSKLQILSDPAISSPKDEGRAMMQIIRDVAPNARQAFHTGFGIAGIAAGIRDLAAAGSEVIVDDLINFRQPFFQDGEIAQVTDSVASEGIPYFSAATNYAQQSYSSEFREASAGGRTFHDFDPTSSVDIYQTIHLPVGESVSFSLQWTDPYFSAGGPGADADIDVFVVNDTLGTEKSSTDSNVGSDPIEVFTFTNDGNTDADGDGQEDTRFQIAVELSAGPSPELVKYIYFNDANGALSIEEYDTRSPASFGHPNAKNVAGVAAASYKDTPAFGTDPPQVQDFSSEGGVPIYFDKDGNALSSPVVRNKPDFTAPDDADNTFFGQDTDGDGFPNFTGTSAAAPHAAAIAALMLDKNPSLTPQEIYQKLAGSAIDMDNPATAGFDSGFDFRTGTGLIQADRALSAVQAQTRLYVDADATGKNTGASWTDAYTTLQDAFDEANLHPSREYEIWVAEGTYRPDVDSIGHTSSEPFDHPIGDRAESFTLTRDSVEVYGGFSGSESTRDQRDPSGNEVALSGDIGARSDTSDNSYHVVYLDGRSREPITGATVLDGLTIAEGNARGAFPNDSGGGVFCEGGGTGNDCQPALSNLLIRDNDAIFGGGLFINGSDTEFTTSTTGGTTTGGTGQATAKSQATGKASRSVYPESGDARRGAGGRSYSAPTSQRKSPGETRVGSSPDPSPRNGSLESGSATTKATSGHQALTLSGSEFRGNFAESSGGAVYNYGSGSTSSPVFQEVLFTENKASFGGALYNDGRSSGDASPLLISVDFTSNRALQSGGAIYSSGDSGSSSLFLTRSRLVLNEADFGGALYFDGSDGGSAQPVVGSSLLAGNVADTSGGAAYSLGLDGTVSPSYVNATMAGNEARFGGGLYNDGRSGTASVRARNTILWKNAAGSGPQAFNSASGTTFGVSYSLVDGGTSGITESGGSSTTYDGSTNLEADPQFASGADGDGQWGTGDDDLRLQGPGSSGGSSPAIDAGINDALDLDGDGTDEITKDVAGNDRLKEVSGASDSGSGSGPLVDMGAYESSGSPLPVELARLDARLEDGAVSVQWTTLSETENAGFAVQRKRQDGGWKQVGFVGGAGTTTQPQSYSLVDRDIPFEADSLSYRLRQVDTDGTISFSDAVTVRRGAPSLKLLSTYPNPARQQATVRYAVPERQEITIRLHDVLGREVRTLVRSRKEGRQKLSLDVGGLSSGVYFLRLQAGGEMRTQKLTIVR